MAKLYTIGCPQCNVLERKLNEAGIEYGTVTDREIMKREGITVLPVLEVGGRRMGFGEAIKWLKKRGDSHED